MFGKFWISKFDRWQGAEVVCLASGPSLRTDDCEAVRRWRQEESGGTGKRRVIVANTTFRAAPWADALFAMDRAWWDKYHEEVRRDFKGECFTTNILPSSYPALRLSRTTFNGFRNSGASCIELAALMGARKAVLLGFDCQRTNGHSHWHGDHPFGLGNAGSVNKWHDHFNDLAKHIRNKMEVVNCSRATALQAFPTGVLEDHLS